MNAQLVPQRSSLKNLSSPKTSAYNETPIAPGHFAFVLLQLIKPVAVKNPVAVNP